MSELSVLVVDDSAMVREVMPMILSHDGRISVDTAADPLIAMHKIAKHRPDVILLDLELPGMNGLDFLRKLMQDKHPIPVVVCSIHAEAAMEALREGAVEVLTKPRLGIREFLEESAVIFVDAVRGAAQAQGHKAAALPLQPKLTADAILPSRRPPALPGNDMLVAIGASTGGTEAIAALLSKMPADGPGIVIVQHMPENFTRAWADSMAKTSPMAVREAKHGERVTPGVALVAPGNRHTLVVRRDREYLIEVVNGPLVCRHRPSVDVLFRSAAIAAGTSGIGVLLTGMGDDGAQGLCEMRRAGAWTIAQDEASCVVFGMPKEAIAAGGVEETLPLDRIPAAIGHAVRAKRGRAVI